MNIYLYLDIFKDLPKDGKYKDFMSKFKYFVHFQECGQIPVTEEMVLDAEKGNALIYPDVAYKSYHIVNGEVLLKTPNYVFSSIGPHHREAVNGNGFPKILEYPGMGLRYINDFLGLGHAPQFKTPCIQYNKIQYADNVNGFYVPGSVLTKDKALSNFYVSRESVDVGNLVSGIDFSILPSLYKGKFLKVGVDGKPIGETTLKEFQELISDKRNVKECVKLKGMLVPGFIPNGVEEGKDLRYQDSVSRYHFYQSARQPKINETTRYLVGIEVEKEDPEVQTSIRHEHFFGATGWAKERDGSLYDDGGFEIVSPTYDLFNDALIEDIRKNPILLDHVNSDYSDRCGGHINVSLQGKPPKFLFNRITGYFPLLYALYPDRTKVRHSFAKKVHEYVGSDKYSSIYIRKNRVEIRIFPAVANDHELYWRLRLVRYMVNNLGLSEADVLKEITSKTSELYNLLLEYSESKYFGNKLYQKQFLKSKGKYFINVLAQRFRLASIKYNDFDAVKNERLETSMSFRTQMEEAVVLRPNPFGTSSYSIMDFGERITPPEI